MGVNRTQHYANGTPAVNTNFWNLKGLVEYGHSKKVRRFSENDAPTLKTFVGPVVNYGAAKEYTKVRLA